MELAVEAHALSKLLARRGARNLASQLERAGASIPANIDEGNGRRSRADYVRHLSIANGSLLELETHVLLAQRLSLLGKSDGSRALSLASEVGRMLAGLIRRLRENDASSLDRRVAGLRSVADSGPDADPRP